MWSPYSESYLLGLLFPIAGIVYVIMRPPRGVSWLPAVVSLVFLFIAVVPMAALAVIDAPLASIGNYNPRWGVVIVLLAFMLLVQSCGDGHGNRAGRGGGKGAGGVEGKLGPEN